jgi:hypothetical protein
LIEDCIVTIDIGSHFFGGNTLGDDGSGDGDDRHPLGTQGSTELAFALFSGQGLAPYAPDQYTLQQIWQKNEERLKN